MPAWRQRSRSPFIEWAVSAMTGRCPPAVCSRRLQFFDHLEPVEFGHLDVEEHQVEGALVQGLEGLATIACDDDLVASAAQEMVDELLVEDIVLGQQDAQPGRRCGRIGGSGGRIDLARGPVRAIGLRLVRSAAVRAPGR